MVILYVQGQVEVSSTHAVSLGFKHILEATGSSNEYFLNPRTRTLRKRKVELSCYQYATIDWGEEYIGTSRTLGERYKEHLREPSPIQVHSHLTGHQPSQDNFSIIGRKGQGITRLIKASIFIRVNKPTLNRNIGMFQLIHIWDGVANQKGKAQHIP